MARKPEITELPTRLLMAAIGSERRYKNILIFGGIAVVALGAAVYGLARFADAREVAARDASWGALSTCLLGANPLKSGETASARVASIKLAFVSVPLEKRAKAGELAWPASCSSYAHALGEHLSGDPVGEAAQNLGKALRADTTATNDIHAEVEKLWALAATSKLKADTSANVAAAPTPAAPLFAADAWSKLPRLLTGTFALGNVREAPTTGNKIHFIIDQRDMPEGPVFCTITSTDTSVKCMKLPQSVATLSPGVRLWGTTDDGARPFFFAGDRGQLGIFPPEGHHAIAAGITSGAAAHADGSIALLMRKDSKDLHLIVQPAVGASNDQVLLPATEVEQPAHAGLFFDYAAYRRPGKPAHLTVRKIEGATAKPALDVGDLDEEPPSGENAVLTGCKSDDAVVLRVRGQRNDAISFFAGGRWAAPVKAPTHGGVLTCRGLEAVTTTIEHAPERDKDYPLITQARCNTSGCSVSALNMRQMLAGIGDIAPADVSSSLAADANGKLLLMWNAGPVGGLRMRLAPPAQIRDAEDVVITDGRDEKSATHLSSIAEMKVLSANSFAVVLLNTTSGVKVLRIEPTGQVTPLGGAI